MKQAKVLLDYAEGTLQSTPMLRQLIEQRTKDTLVLTTGITLEVRSASFRRNSSHPLVPDLVPIYGYVYDVKNGRLVEVPEATKVGEQAAA